MQETWLQELLSEWVPRPGALLPVLHAVQERCGHVPRDMVPAIAEALNLSRAEVHGVVTYYHHFRSEAPGRHVLQVCCAEACQACGSDALMTQAQALLGCAAHGTAADGSVSLEPVYCLGLCALSPAVMLGEQPHGRVTPARLKALVAEMKATA
jgi:formate dehydrogenase subunit gamma